MILGRQRFSSNVKETVYSLRALLVVGVGSRGRVRCSSRTLESVIAYFMFGCQPVFTIYLDGSQESGFFFRRVFKGIDVTLHPLSLVCGRVCRG